ncbi:hypothetical protein [Rathayibacter sp. YIM 133350]|uniref:hypothetical protein n=1 Tax=Rathayibacter sp. YIM 133350 TaxID=3131992 RepID=UPI00307EB2FE
MPERLRHHARQQLRWMRGSFIRSWWRFRYIPLSHPAYWLHAAKWIAYVAVTVVFVALLFSGALLTPGLLLWALGVTIGIQLAVTSRYLSIARSDQSVGQRCLVYLTAPAMALWSWFVLRALRWYAMATYRDVGWKTRDDVEVRVD